MNARVGFKETINVKLIDGNGNKKKEFKTGNKAKYPDKEYIKKWLKEKKGGK